MNRKTFASAVELKQGAEGVVRAAFATLNVIDNDGDITEPGAFGTQAVRVQPFGHDLRALPVGKGSIFEEADKAVLEAQLNLETQPGRDMLSGLKFDLDNGPPLIEWSYTFDILEATDDVRDGTPVRILKRLKVHSVDPVFIGAGVATATLSAKDGPQRFADQMADADTALAAVADFVARAGALAALKREEGKELGAEHVERLRIQLAKLGEVVTLLEPLTTVGPDPALDEAMAQFLRFQKIRMEART